jgi:hypothetical protein
MAATSPEQHADRALVCAPLGNTARRRGDRVRLVLQGDGAPDFHIPRAAGDG